MKSNTQKNGGVRGSRSQPPTYIPKNKTQLKQINLYWSKRSKKQLPQFIRGEYKRGFNSRLWNYSQLFRTYIQLANA